MTSGATREPPPLTYDARTMDGTDALAPTPDDPPSSRAQATGYTRLMAPGEPS